MNVICTPRFWSSSFSDQSCTSATKLPSVDSPPRFSTRAGWPFTVPGRCARLNAPSVVPMTTLPSSLATAVAAVTIGTISGSGSYSHAVTLPAASNAVAIV